MNGTGDHCVKRDKPSSKSQISHIFHVFVEFRPKIMMILIMGYECKSGIVCGGEISGRRRRKGKGTEG
jgi:hypothetical protein